MITHPLVEAKDRKVDLILDSGAFSAWKKREKIELGRYISFLDEWADCVEIAVNLDIIPGRWGVVPSPSEIDASAEQGFKHALELRAAGHEVLPVYHQGERLYWLEKLVGEGFQYIGISPGNDRRDADKQKWLDGVFSYLCGDAGYPSIKTHAFGVTSIPLLYRFPWWSADSVSWLLTGGYGGIFIPRGKRPDGKYNFDLPPYTVAISSRSDRRGEDMTVRPVSLKYQADRNYASMGEASRVFIDEFIAWCGFTTQQVKDEYLVRQNICARFFKEVMAVHTTPRFVKEHRGFFADESPSGLGQTTPLGPLKIVFTTTTSDTHSSILQALGLRDRLLTYYYFMQTMPFDLREYVKTGVITPYPRRKRGKKRAKLIT